MTLLKVPISVNHRGYTFGLVANHLNKTYQSYPRFSPKSVFIIAESLFIQYDLWYTWVWGYGNDNVTFVSIMENNSAVYNNGDTILVMKFDD